MNRLLYDYILLEEYPLSNERLYSHIQCQYGIRHWIIPMDDAPRPSQSECPGCDKNMPVYILVDNAQGAFHDRSVTAK